MAEHINASETQTHLHAQPKIKRTLPPTAWFVIIALTAVAGYFAGTYSRQIISVVAPAFGIKVYAGQIDLSSLQKVYQDLKANYDGTIDDKALVDGAAHGLVAAINDKYTLYMNASEAKSFNDDLSGNIGGGIGVEVSTRSDNITIISVLAGDPAEASGIKAGDIVTAINGQSIVGETLDQAVLKLRGDVGTTVKITVLRAGTSMDFSVTRAIITSPSVTSSVANGVGTLTITRFDDQTTSLAQAAAQTFVSQHVKSVILDLRDNGGGYVDAAQSVAGLWIDHKLVVTEKTNGKVVSSLTSTGDPLLAGIPTVVLVNGNSASASEIVAGALQDYKIATLVGEKTYGKGSIQQILPLPDGAQVKITIAKWYTPSGKNINEQGITPTVVVDLTQDNLNAGVDPQMAAALKTLGQ